MKFLSKLDNQLLTAVIVLIVSLLGFAATGFLIPSSYQHIPFGFLLSGGIISVIYVISSILERVDVKRGSTTFSIIAIIMRLVVLLTSLALVGLMYYKWNIKLFNIFVFVGMYTAGVGVHMLVTVFRKPRKE